MVKICSLPYIFQVLYVLCVTRPRYQVSVYRTIGPLVKKCLCVLTTVCATHLFKTGDNRQVTLIKHATGSQPKF